MIREKALMDAANLCEEYAFSLMIEKPDWAEVALECARIIDDMRKRALSRRMALALVKSFRHFS